MACLAGHVYTPTACVRRVVHGSGSSACACHCVQVLQLGAGVGVLVPVASVLGSGVALSGSELGLLGGVVAGTVACGASMSWYCERFVGELSWQPAARALRVSTLSVWGSRTDRDIHSDIC